MTGQGHVPSYRQRSRSQIEGIMRQIGLSDRIDEARRILPEVVDIDRDADLLSRLGLSLDRIVDRMGGSAW
jgi:hypothetical protein